MVWQLLQVRHVKDAPLILVGDMWEELVEWAQRTMVDAEPAMASPEDMQIPQCVHSIEDAIEIVRAHHARWGASD